MSSCPLCGVDVSESSEFCQNCKYPISKIREYAKSFQVGIFDLVRVRSLSRDSQTYVPLDDNRWGVVLSDETHRILTTILNQYSFNEKAVCREQVKFIRDEILSKSNLGPIADFWWPYVIARNKGQEAFMAFKELVQKIRSVTETGAVQDYLDWLMSDQFITVDLVTNRSAMVKILDKDWKEVMNLNSGKVKHQVKLLPIVDTFQGFTYVFIAREGDQYSCKKIKIEKNQVIELFPTPPPSGHCSSCNREFVQVYLDKTCPICNGFLCADCAVTCSICKLEYGKNHLKKCKECGVSLCSNCVRRSGFILKKNYCPSCYEKSIKRT